MRFDRTLPGFRFFRRHIFSWWAHHKRDLPWRTTRDPYRILVSEVMLQQTQVLRVLPKYAELIEAFPTVDDLANASPAKIVKMWKGMGYNRRALYLHRAAKMITETYNSKFPISEQQLTKLPGVGTYTARALLVFAFGQDVAMVDTNIRQIITHFFFKGRPQKEKVIQEIADRILPVGRSWEWHQALMDYGAIGLPKANRPERSRRASTPFKDSNRFYRGKIIDLLRERKQKEINLISNFMKRYGKTQDFYETIITGLIKDGLVIRRNKILTLPE